MSTVNNVIVANFPATSTTLNFNYMWRLTRAMKKAGWKYIASGNGTSKEQGTLDPALDNWNNAPTTTNAGGTTPVVATPTRGRATVTVLTGVVSADKGRFLVLAGTGVTANNHAHQIEEVISATSVRIDARTFAVASSSAGTWTIVDYNSDTYPAGLASVSAWWAARGPSTLKIPITAAPVVGGGGFSFLRGENIVQASTGAEGEIVGWVFDSGAGYLVVAPRLRGTGSGVYGWDTANVITGSLTGATVTQVGTALEYRHEVVFWKANNETSGSYFIGTFEPVAETMFSSLTGAAGCTATVAPGGGGTGNTFPTFAWLQWGSTTSGSHAIWAGTASSGQNLTANAQIMCVDGIEEEDYSADASWTIAMGLSALAGGGHAGFGFHRLDDGEDGDLDPYAGLCLAGQATLYNNTRTSLMTGPNNSNVDLFTATVMGGATTGVFWRGWRRRGLSGDAATNSQDFELFADRATQSVLNVMAANVATPAIVATNPSTTPIKVREPLRIGSVQVARKMHKGTVRWLTVVEGGNGTDLYDSRRFIQLSPTNGCVVAGPWDGSSTPTVT